MTRSRGRGKMMVEFFSAEMLFRVWDSKHVNNRTVHPTFTNICTMLEDRSMRLSVVCRTFSLVRPRDKECVWLVLVGDTGITAG